MIHKNFRSKQSPLLEARHVIAVIYRIIAGASIFTAGLVSSIDEQSSAGPLLVWFAIGVAAVGGIARSLIKTKLESNFWDEYEKIIGTDQSSHKKDQCASDAGPTIQDNAKSIIVRRCISGAFKGLTTTLQDIYATHSVKLPNNTHATIKLHYIVQSIQLNNQVPHLFIASKKQSNKRLSGASNLWALTTKLVASQKIPDLEGDFSKYFTVYAPFTQKSGQAYQQIINALRVLTPDVMITLRDKGHNFSYELYGSTLYIIHEPNLLSSEDLENYIQSANAALAELTPQLTNHNFSDKAASLKTHALSLVPDMFLTPATKIAKYTLLYLAIILLGYIVGTSVF